VIKKVKDKDIELVYPKTVPCDHMETWTSARTRITTITCKLNNQKIDSLSVETFFGINDYIPSKCLTCPYYKERKVK